MNLILLAIAYQLLWSIFAVRMHFKIGYPKEVWRVFLVWTLNFIFAPIAMIIAIVRCPIKFGYKPTEGNE